ncbi:phosphoribosyltransferase-like protein [Lelliottia sp. CFBP8978]|uniref:phosphoribosyltransferase-like protein n=1 Tax=Lelliottia sp. CFBP8978 TaxID=3096522 RepID=UPI002A69CA3E|nr:hypothetical protein [Lelliottia sp. CFBP8978]MDY1037525.1 hypothetical protein [Lelliottia sp. CFBP8978]
MNSNSPLRNKVSEEINFNFIVEVIDAQPWIQNFEDELITLFEFCDNHDQKKLLCELLKRFFYLNDIKEREACLALNSKINEWKLSPENTWIVAVANKSEVDGSSAGLQKLKNKIKPIEEWHNRYIANIPSAIDHIKNGDNVVLFDDFIGTGGKIERKEKWLKKLLSENGIDVNTINIFITGFAGMQFGLKAFSEKSESLIYVKHVLLKGISESFSLTQIEYYIDIMLSLENKLGKRYKNKSLPDYSLGFNRSETLYCGANDNCPNNVFPVLWWPIIKNDARHCTLLTRAG